MTIYFPSWWNWQKVSDYISAKRLFHRLALGGIDWDSDTGQWFVTFDV